MEKPPASTCTEALLCLNIEHSKHFLMNLCTWPLVSVSVQCPLILIVQSKHSDLSWSSKTGNQITVALSLFHFQSVIDIQGLEMLLFPKIPVCHPCEF